MPRRPTPCAGQSTHVTVRCNNKEFLFDLSNNFDAIISWTNSLPCLFKVDVHHALFMSNHIHLFLTPKENNFGNAMSYYLSNLAKFLNFVQGRKNHIFGCRYLPTVIQDERHYMNVIRYIYQNPVKANIVDMATDYFYSSLGSYLGERNAGLVLTADKYTQNLFEGGLQGRNHWLSFIERQMSDEDAQVMQESLQRRSFKFSIEQCKKIRKLGTSLVL